MKKYTHAWLALKAVGLLNGFRGKFSSERNQSLDRFLDFIGTHRHTFVRGAWFPDTVVRDNTRGGHTWKYYLDERNGTIPDRRPPSHQSCLDFVRNRMDARLSLDRRISDLPDRCEALGQAIRDTILITNKVDKGDVVGFNNSQIAVFFLMLSHYVCDAHVPLHCDNRDLYKPSKVHPDLEAFWEKEIIRYYPVSKKSEQFDLDQDGSLQRDMDVSGFGDSILYQLDNLLEQSEWAGMESAGSNWRVFLGHGNNNFWDYMVSVCVVSFHMSQLMFPPDAEIEGERVDYDRVRIMDTHMFRDNVMKFSPHILADAVNSVALLWLAAWERWELLSIGER